MKQEWYLSSRKLEKEISQGKRNASVQAGENFSTESKSVHQVMECQWWGYYRVNRIRGDYEHRHYRKYSTDGLCHLMASRVKCKKYSEICYFVENSAFWQWKQQSGLVQEDSASFLTPPYTSVKDYVRFPWLLFTSPSLEWVFSITTISWQLHPGASDQGDAPLCQHFLLTWEVLWFL